MVNIIGTGLLWLLALAMVAVFPLTEFARGMSSGSPGKVSRGGCLISLIGLALIGLLAREAFGGV